MNDGDVALMIAVMLSIILHGIGSWVWHIVPSLREPDARKVMPGMDASMAWQAQMPTFHVHMPSMPALPPPGPVQTNVLANGRQFDPAKQRQLIEQFWTQVLPVAPKSKQKVAQFLPAFDRLCAQENIETPTADVFCALSMQHLPAVETLAGAYWFTPS
jgi:hypothetical protein